MLYTLTLKLEAYHKPSESWHVHEVKHRVRAVSRKHALNKGLKVVTSWPGYQDRVNEPDWQVGAEATLDKSDRA
jgi:hypothetical protein